MTTALMNLKELENSRAILDAAIKERRDLFIRVQKNIELQKAAELNKQRRS